ncbi:uncharacterized protein K02A2.6-like [Uranotaenia lowii]|uniref:uncharacterized protein K02A2.6-like n=1 Tax=Uranotaenia lowii TaxID=190385 RepID=UPI002478E008|nr:uncharacterized protein K02A2.6-like [Uranotaenia lowii]
MTRLLHTAQMCIEKLFVYGESLDKFIQRLRDQGRLCGYGEALDMRITEQVFDNSNSDALREVILKKKLMTVQEIAEEGRILETLKVNKELLKKPTDENAIGQVRRNKEEHCYRCGEQGHFANNKKCPAMSEFCKKCNRKGHYAKQCKTKYKSAGEQSRSKNRVRQVRCSDKSSSSGSDSEESDNQLAQVYAAELASDVVTCFVGGVKLNWVVDSGAHVNVINRETYKLFRKNGCIMTKSERSSKELKVYGDGRLKVYKVIKIDIATKSKTVHHEIYVVETRRGAKLLSKKTSMELGLLEIHGEIFNIGKPCEPSIGKLKHVQVEIKIDSAIPPVQQSCRRLPIPLQPLVDEKLESLLKQDVIEPAPLDITWASPLVVTPKDGGRDVRICVDMRKANKAIIPEKHPLPTFEEIMPHLDGCKLFSKIDLVKAFHQIELAPNSRDITTFVTQDGYYRYKRLMFGMKVAAEIFQRCIERVLKGLKGVKVFIDDILVYASSKGEHDIRLKAVLNRLKEFGFTINEAKCEYGKSSVVFMGHLLSNKGILPSDDKVSAIKNFRRPQNATEMRSFLGLANYVGRFIPNLSTLSTPLRDMTIKNTKFRWNSAAKTAFTQIKEALANPKHLAYYGTQYPTILVTDASDTGLGAVLLQVVRSKPRPISYASKSLSKTEKKYSTLDKEALAIVWATEPYEMYLRGLDFTIVTDHKPLVKIFSESSKPNQRQERWVLRMQSFRYSIVYSPGETNIADPLSRLSECDIAKTFDKQTEHVLSAIVEVTKPTALTMSEIIRQSQEDEQIQCVRRALLDGDWNSVPKGFLPFKTELCSVKDVLLRANKIVIPEGLRAGVLDLSHVGHPGKEKMKRRLRAAVWWPGIDVDVEKKCRRCVECLMVSLPNKPEPLRIRELPSTAWFHLSADFLGPLPNGKYIFVLVDLYSRFVIAEFMTRTTSADVIRFLKQVFTRMGLPTVLTTDNAKNFSSQELKDYCVDFGIKLSHTTPYWPSANGEVERQNRSLLKVLKISQQKGTNLEEALQEYLYMYSVTPHSVTGVAPATLVFGRRFRDLFPHWNEVEPLDEEMRDRDNIIKHQTKESRDRRVGAKEASIQVGDEVLMKNTLPRNKLSPTFLPTPTTVTTKHGSSITVKAPSGQEYTRNSSHLKLIPRTQEERNPVSSDAFEAEEWNKESSGSSRSRPTRITSAPKKFEDYIMQPEDSVFE